MTATAIVPQNRITKQKTSDSALSVLPREWRRPVSFFYSFHSEILKGTLCLATRFQYWIKKKGLTLEEANEAMMALMEPDVAGDVTFGAQQLQGMLAQEVERIIAARKAREHAAALRRRAEESADSAAPASVVSELLRGVVSDVKEVKADPDSANNNADFARQHRAA